MGYEETISERIAAGFLSDTPEGKEQIRAAKVRMFFHDYSLWNPDVSDGSDLQEMEHLLGITPDEWEANRQSFTVQF